MFYSNSAAMATDDNSTVTRVAFCSALCAGFAYVGYNMVSKIFFKTAPMCDKNKSNGEIVSKFLSKSVQTDAPLMVGDYYNASKTVRERVKDLNVMVKQFRKNSIPLPVSPERRPPSSLASPWSSPLGCAKYLSCSAENISSTSPLSSPDHKRKTKFPRHAGKSTECIPAIRDSWKCNTLSKIPLPPDLEITMKTLRSLQKVPRKMTLFEMRNIISLLYSEDEDILVKTLSTVSNCAAFSSNQEQLCNAGCPDRLYELLQHPSEAVKVAAAQAISNIAVMDKGYHYFQPHIPTLFDHSQRGGELLKSISLTALANLALNDSAHKSMVEDINSILTLVESDNSVVQLQALRLLVNLSCNKEMIPFLLLTKVSPCVFKLLHTPGNREIKLRFLTFLANIITYAVRDLHISSKTSTLMSSLYQLREQSDLKCIEKLANDHDEDLRYQASRLWEGLNQKPN